MAVFALLFLVVFAPLMRGGNRHVALIVLEGAALVLLVALLGRTKPGTRRVSFQGALLLFLLASPAWLALVYLLPVPAALWAATAGREGYLPALGSAGIESPSWLPLSLVPDATLSSVLAGIPLAAAFCAGYRLQPSPLALVLRAFVVLVFLQVIVGLLQVAGGSDSSLYFGDGGGRPLGTFANPNHFANYLAMGLCVYVWLAWTQISRSGHPELQEYGFSPRLRRLALWAAAGMLLVIGILISRSRGAMLAGLPVTMCALALVARSTAHTQARRAALVFTAVATLVAVSVVGFEFVLSRFDLETFGKAAAFRGLLAETTFRAAAAFWPWGAGWGTYGVVYPRFQPPEIVGVASYAHHDYAQLLFEGGIFSVLLMAAFAWLAIRRAVVLVRAGLRRRRLHREELMVAVCGIALLGFLLHSLVEFNMHIPANAIMASLLAGIYLRPLESEEAPGD